MDFTARFKRPAHVCRPSASAPVRVAGRSAAHPSAAAEDRPQEVVRPASLAASAAGSALAFASAWLRPLLKPHTERTSPHVRCNGVYLLFDPFCRHGSEVLSKRFRRPSEALDRHTPEWPDLDPPLRQRRGRMGVHHPPLQQPARVACTEGGHDAVGVAGGSWIVAAPGRCGSGCVHGLTVPLRRPMFCLNRGT